MGIRKKLAFQALTYAAAMGATALAGKGSNAGWKLAKKENPPLNPAARKTSWKSALAFAAISGAVGAMAGVAARTGVARGWQAKVGKIPMGER